jgi:LysR family cys regulon transcriptional activator
VRLGLGVGIVAEMAVRDDPADGDLVARPLGHLFGPTWRAWPSSAAPTCGTLSAFAELLSDRLTRTLVERAMRGGAGDDYQL